MWEQQKRWEHLVSREHGVSADLVRLFNCITSLVSSRLRAKTLASVHAWSQLVLCFKVTHLAIVIAVQTSFCNSHDMV
jgi:hypothetical protein